MRQIILLAAFEALFLINYSIQKNKSDSVTGMIGKDRYCEITVGEAYRLISAQEVMVDIRTREDYDGGHRENAITVSHKIIRDEIPEALQARKRSCWYTAAVAVTTRSLPKSYGSRGIRAFMPSVSPSTGPMRL